MIVYEYRCQHCTKVVEDNRNNAFITHCKDPMKRVYSIAGIKFKGPGFYRNDRKFDGR